MVIICRVTGTPFALIRRRMIAPSITGLGALAAGLSFSLLLEPRVPAIAQLAGTATVAGSVALALLLTTSSKVRTAGNQLRARNPQAAMNTMLELIEPVAEPSR